MKKKTFLLAIFTLLLVGNFVLGFSQRFSKTDDVDIVSDGPCTYGYTLDRGFGAGGYYECCVSGSLSSCCNFNAQTGTCPQPPPE